tara:strand:- start:16971 stop:17543 length:573 start_codon:yes stop_codon:yes gene_type:complete
MIASLKGTILQKKEHAIALDVGGVGYEVAIPSNELIKLKTGDELLVFTYLSVSERVLDLYGSADEKVIEWFKMLLNVKGVGPKSALAIISKANPEDLSAALQNESVDILVNCGINKKAAERIVLELKNKAKDLITTDSSATSKSAAVDSEAIQALEALGYSREQAREALKSSEGSNVEEKVRWALQILGS